jgi:secondary thiamine-phosphate synthase enzyme
MAQLINKVLLCTRQKISKYSVHYEGDDDMPAHLKSSILGVSLNIPISQGELNLGIWQGIYLCEHRNHGGSRQFVATISGKKYA